MSDAMVEVSGLRKSFTSDSGRFDVLHDVSFSIRQGEMVALVGVSGAGKTTLLQILGGLDCFDSGTVVVGGRDVAKASSKSLAEFRNRQIGFVFQFHHLLPDFTALENVTIPGIIQGIDRNECVRRARELLGLLGLLPRQSHFPTELSGGERQRVALARALFNNPALILADEPTGNLDEGNSEVLLELFRKTNRELHQTFLIATHNCHLMQGLHRALYLDSGRITETVPS